MMIKKKFLKLFDYILGTGMKEESPVPEEQEEVEPKLIVTDSGTVKVNFNNKEVQENIKQRIEEAKEFWEAQKNGKHQVP